MTRILIGLIVVVFSILGTTLFTTIILDMAGHRFKNIDPHKVALYCILGLIILVALLVAMIGISIMFG